MSEFGQEHGRRVKVLDAAAVAALRTYQWPGNVRELRNVLERLTIMVPGETIQARDLAFLNGGRAAPAELFDVEGGVLSLQEARERFEREYILKALATQQGNMSRTAQALGVERSNLYRKMRAFGLAPVRKSVAEDF